MRKNYTLCCLAGIAATLTACADPISSVAFDDWEPEMALPVLSTRFTLADAMRGFDFQGALDEAEDHELRIHVREQLFDVNPSEFVELLDVSIPLLDTATHYRINDEGAVLPVSRMITSEGKVSVAMRNDYPFAADVELRVPNFTTAAGPMVYRFRIPALSTYTEGYDLGVSELRLDLAGTVDVNYAARLEDGRAVRLTAGVISFTETDFSYVEGRLDSLAIDLGRDSVALDFLDIFKPGEVALVDPVARLHVRSSTGAAISLRTDGGEALTAGGETIAVDTELDRGFEPDYPSDPAHAVEVESFLQIDKTNSNLVGVLNRFPKQLKFGLRGLTTNVADDSTFFMYRDSRLQAELELDVPLELRFNGFTLEQELDVSVLGRLAEAKSAGLVLRTVNGFGLDAIGQFYFYDTAGDLRDSLFDEGPLPLLSAAEVREDGSTIAPTTSRNEFELSPRKIANLADSRRAVVRLRLLSPENGSTALYSNSEIALQIGATVVLNSDADVIEE